MTLFAPDLYRNFAFGFVAGGMVVAAVTVGDWSHHFATPANAAEVQSAVIQAPADEFLITPLGD